MDPSSFPTSPWSGPFDAIWSRCAATMCSQKKNAGHVCWVAIFHSSSYFSVCPSTTLIFSKNNKKWGQNDVNKNHVQPFLVACHITSRIKAHQCLKVKASAPSIAKMCRTVAASSGYRRSPPNKKTCSVSLFIYPTGQDFLSVPLGRKVVVAIFSTWKNWHVCIWCCFASHEMI